MTAVADLIHLDAALVSQSATEGRLALPTYVAGFVREQKQTGPGATDAGGGDVGGAL
jgi:hypothetical protein